MQIRKTRRSKLRLECLPESRGGGLFRGYTLNISADDAELESNDLGSPGRPELKGGDHVFFSFYYRKKGSIESVKVSARVIYVMGQHAGLYLFASELQHTQRDDFATILSQESDRVG